LPVTRRLAWRSAGRSSGSGWCNLTPDRARKEHKEEKDELEEEVGEKEEEE
jgi:hypothetical protein